MSHDRAPKVAVYMIVKNGQKELHQCFQSVVEQKPDAYIIVDTGSTDDTVAMVREYLKGQPESFRPVEAYVSPWRFDDCAK